MQTDRACIHTDFLLLVVERPTSLRLFKKINSVDSEEKILYEKCKVIQKP